MIVGAGELLRLNLALGCLGVERDSLVRVDEGERCFAVPRFAIGHLHDGGGYVRYFRADVDDSIRKQLLALAPAVALSDHERVSGCLAAHAPCERVRSKKRYVFPDLSSPSGPSDVLRLVPPPRELIEDYEPEIRARVAGRPAFVVLCEDQIASYCMSARETARAAEAWVQTRPEFRRRGLAHQVVLAWARDAQQQGRVAFYSHFLENVGSERVAHGLALVHYATFTEYL